MTDKKTKKEMDAVIDKYIGRHWGKKALGVTSGVIVGGLLGLDLLLTGGIGTAGILFATGSAGAAGLLGRKVSYTPTAYANAAGQTVEYGNVFVAGALGEMEEKLKAAFGKAAAPDAPESAKNDFKNLADEITQDTRKLFPLFKILSGTPKDRYEFVVAESFTAPGKKKPTTLTEALQKLYPAAVPEKQAEPAAPKKPTPEEEIQQLKARLEALENPKIVRLDKNPNNPPSP